MECVCNRAGVMKDFHNLPLQVFVIKIQHRVPASGGPLQEGNVPSHSNTKLRLRQSPAPSPGEHFGRKTDPVPTRGVGNVFDADYAMIVPRLQTDDVFYRGPRLTPIPTVHVVSSPEHAACFAACDPESSSFGEHVAASFRHGQNPEHLRKRVEAPLCNAKSLDFLAGSKGQLGRTASKIFC